MIYHFDGNATMPTYQEVLDVFVEFSHRHWVNSSALYRRASSAQEQLTLARHQIAEVLNLDPERIIFTANASVSHSLLFSALTKKLPANSAVLSSPLEHASVRLPFTQIFTDHRQHFITPQTNLQIDLTALEQALKKNQISFLSLMTAHNESGILNPMDEIQSLCKHYNVLWHSDAVQCIGKTKFKPQADWQTFSSHKFGGIKGFGFLILPEDSTKRFPLNWGGLQEHGYFAGTVNVAGAASTALALKKSINIDIINQSQARDLFEKKLLAHFPELPIFGRDLPRLSNTSLILMPRHDRRKWLAHLDALGFEISTGAACSSSFDAPSSVANTLQLPQDQAHRILRISSTWQTQPQEWLLLADAIIQVDRQLTNKKPLQKLNLPQF